MEERRWMPSPEGLTGGVLGVIDKVVAWLVVGGLALMALVIFIQVAARYAFNSPTVWSEELAISLFVWVTMLAIPLGLRRGEHLTLDFVTKRFSGGAAKAFAIVVAALNVLMFGVLIVLTFKLLPAADQQLLAGIAGGFGIQAKVSWVYAAVIVGGALSVVFSIERAVLFTMGRITTLFEDPDQLLIEELEHELGAESSTPRRPGDASDASAPNRTKED